MKTYFNPNKELSLPEKFISGLSYFLFPEVCGACRRPLFEHERKVCSLCLSSLPRTRFHLIKDNPVEKIFWGRVPLVSATAFLFFKKGNRTQRLMHAIKYREQPEVGEILGELFGEDLKLSPGFSSCETVLPIPLHPDKLKSRGYNQCDFLAQGIAQGLGIDFRPNGLIRNVANITQTKKKRIDRWDNVDGIFSANPDALQSEQHILLVDDVVTTGATLESAAHALIREGHRVSVATLAYADKRS
jgi:ComF family protein